MSKDDPEGNLNWNCSSVSYLHCLKGETTFQEG
jgi:hypothetical protein